MKNKFLIIIIISDITIELNTHFFNLIIIIDFVIKLRCQYI